jgi:predicted heme/steroid binding protein/uncharacterized membrane protein
MDEGASTGFRTISAEELAEFNGAEGKPTYIAVQDKIYDVSKSTLWRKGLHMNRHASGRDLTAEITAAPHGREVLERYPQIGAIQKSAPEELKHLPRFLQTFLERYPMAKRHPHPIVVHFPIALLMASSLFLILYLITARISFEATSFSLLIVGALSSLFAIGTGLFTWWVNYQLRLTPLTRRKIQLSVVLLIVETAAICWRVWSPNAVVPSMHPLYVMMVFILTPIVGLLGYYGGQMTFPTEKISRSTP